MKFQYRPRFATMTVEQVRNAIRHEWMTYPVKFAAIQAHASRITLPCGRSKTLIRCCRCEELFERNEIEAHHINPVGKLPDTSREAVMAYAERMFVKKQGIKPLCILCHRRTSREDREASKLQEKPTVH